MATELIMPALLADQQQSRHFLYSHSPIQSQAQAQSQSQIRPHHVRSHSYRLPSPQGPQISSLLDASASAMPHNQAYSSPPSPKAQHHLQYGSRLTYMPAVLRRCDEFPSRKVARCETAGSISSTESDSALRRPSTAIMSIPGLSVLGQRLGRRSIAECSRTLDGEWKLDAFPQVTGVPTRKHWKPDSESSVCDDPTCKRTFNYFVRRHHCRKCGNIFCDWHSNANLPLDHNANFNPRAGPSRTCNHCFDQAKALHSRNNSQSSASTVSDVALPAAPMNASPIPGVTPPHNPEVPASVPRDWNWSTF